MRDTLLAAVVASALVLTSTVAAQQQQGDWFVDGANGLDSNQGNAWAVPFKTIPRAITLASVGDEIWVEADASFAHYVPAAAPSRQATFRISVDDIHLRGGFLGTETFLSDAYHVVTIPTGIRDFEFDGFRIVFGNADTGGGQRSRGGGILANGGAGTIEGLKLRNLTIENCRARTAGITLLAQWHGVGVCPATITLTHRRQLHLPI